MKTSLVEMRFCRGRETKKLHLKCKAFGLKRHIPRPAFIKKFCPPLTIVLHNIVPYISAKSKFAFSMTAAAKLAPLCPESSKLAYVKFALGKCSLKQKLPSNKYRLDQLYSF